MYLFILLYLVYYRIEYHFIKYCIWVVYWFYNCEMLLFF